MITVGLTGGIASGKSTVANRFRELGATVIDSDAIARKLLRPGTVAFDKVVREFGDEILQQDGTIDRGKLRRRIFLDAGDRATLENILHPEIIKQIRSEIGRVTDPYVIVEVPLLTENRLQDEFDRVLVVDCPVAEQLKRLSERDHETEETAMQIVSSQATREQRLSQAHDVIENEGSLEHLFVQVGQLHQRYATQGG